MWHYLKNKMIIIKLKGGLGNQLFQYAYGRLLSIKNGVEIKYQFYSNKKDIQREYKLGYFNTKVEFPTFEEIQKTRYSYGFFSKIIYTINKKILRQHNIGYIPGALNKKTGYLEGYWQNYKYLEPIRKELLEEITIKNSDGIKKYDILNKIENTDSVCVNVRRGDYVSNPKNALEYLTFGMEYYEHAFKLIKEKIENPTLFIISDDIEWCKNNIKTDLPIIFFDPNISDYESFIIATKCKHNIIANSSFAFWIAWLNQNPNKVVIAPKKWNNRYTEEYKDLLPKEWMQI